jgi:ATP/ADP translocase
MTDRRGLAPGHAAVLRRDVLAPAALLFVILVAHALLETARDALFLARLGPHLLAVAYIAMAAAALVAVAAVRRWGRQHHPRRMLIAFLAVAGAGTCVLAATITLGSSIVFVLYVWTGFVATLVVPSFWTALDRSLQITEAKRVFGMIGAGGVLGAMVGSAIASLLGRWLPARHLVTAGAIAFGLATIAAMALAPRTAAVEPVVRRPRVEELSRQSRRYVQLLLGVGIVSTVVLTLGDLTFKRVLSERLDPSALAMVFGAIYTGLNALALVIQLVVTPRLLARWGVAGALTILPAILVTSALGFAITGAMIAVIALKLGDGGLRHSLHRISSEILYLPVPSAVRDGWKLVADAVGQRGGQALAAVIVLAMASFGASAQWVAGVTALAGGIWLVAITITRRAYVAQFRATLQAGEIQRDVAIPDLDADAIELLTELLSSPDEIEALAALDLLARRSRIPALVFYHPRVTVVQHALSLLEGDPSPDVARVLAHLLGHSDPKIRAAALATVSRRGANHDRLIAALDDPSPEVRAVALVNLPDEPGTEAAITKLIAGSEADRRALADAIGFSPSVRFGPVLCELLCANEPTVTRQVLHVLARAPTLVEPDRLLPLLEDPRVRGDVRRVLLALGQAGLDRLIVALDDPATSPAVRRHLPRTISRFRSPAAAAALVTRLPHEPDGRTELKLLRGLGRMRTDDPSLPIDSAPIREYIRRVVADAARYASLGERLANELGSASGLIHEILAEKRRWRIEQAFRALGILYPEAGLRSVHDALVGGDEGRRSAAREIVDAIVPAEVRAPLLAALEPHAPDHAGSLATEPSSTYPELVAELLADPSESLRCVVADHVAERRLVALRDDLARLRPTFGPPLVLHAFDQALARLDG